MLRAMAEHDDEIREVMEAERARGKQQPTASEARKLRQQRLRDLRNLLHLPTRKAFVEAIIAYGLRPGSKEFEAALKIWEAGGGASR
jgi:hypothetical protein